MGPILLTVISGNPAEAQKVEIEVFPSPRPRWTQHETRKFPGTPQALLVHGGLHYYRSRSSMRSTHCSLPFRNSGRLRFRVFQAWNFFSGIRSALSISRLARILKNRERAHRKQVERHSIYKHGQRVEFANSHLVKLSFHSSQGSKNSSYFFSLE